MGARLRSWWQKIRKPLEIAVLIIGCTLVTVLLVVIVLAYVFNVNVPGIHGKTLWDWLQLLIVPLVLAVIALLFNRATTRTEQKIAADRYEQDKEIASRHYHQDRQIAERRYQNDRSIALDKQREDLLQTYLDRMSELLLKEKLRSSAPDAEVRNVARVRTITVLFQLDARRIGYVFAFLRETGLMSEEPNSGIISLSGANLSMVDLSQTNLYSVNLSGANLRGANLSNARLLGRAELTGANLDKANLSNANLFFANLSGASLLEANLSGVNLSNANLVRARFSGAILRNANLSDANLSQANFADYKFKEMNGASFIDTRLGGADLSGANLSRANLSQANLSDAKVTPEQLNTARSRKGATMPDGSIHP